MSPTKQALLVKEPFSAVGRLVQRGERGSETPDPLFLDLAIGTSSLIGSGVVVTDACDPFGGEHDGGLARKYLVHEDAMHLLIAVQATVAKHREDVVEVGRLPKGGKDDAARRNAGQNEGIDLERPQYVLEIATRERADAFFRHDDLARLRRNGSMNLALS